MTRVLHVIETLGRGGAEHLLLTLLPELLRQGVAAEVLALRPPFTLQAPLEAQGVPVRHAPHHGKWHLPALARNVARTAARMRADVIHAHLYFPAIGTALARGLGLTQRRTAVTFHNLAYAPGVNPPGPGLGLRRRLARTLYPRGLDLAMAVSPAVARHYAEALGIAPPHLAPNPIDLALLETIQPLPALDAPHILVPGRLVREKGHDLLLAALAQISAPPVVFAGGGPCAEALAARAAALGLQLRITGPLPRDRLLAHMAAADLIVVPSRQEGFGLVALEAMALGRPLLTTQAGGLPDVVGAGAHVVPPEDPLALAAALHGLLADPEARHRLGQAARARAQAFALPQVATQLCARYETLCEKAPR